MLPAWRHTSRAIGGQDQRGSSMTEKLKTYREQLDAIREMKIAISRSPVDASSNKGVEIELTLLLSHFADRESKLLYHIAWGTEKEQYSEGGAL